MIEFEQRFHDELSALAPGFDSGRTKVFKQTGTDEAFVAHVDASLSGIALSGGGIRSATFNLGLLRGLQESLLLWQFQYLATVSGGGYIGSWWTAYRHRTREFFPTLKNGVSPREVRHLREFGNFLSPRIGFFEIDTWQFLGSVIAGAIPSLVAAGAVIALSMLCYLALASLIVSTKWAGGVFFAFMSLVVTIWFENQTARRERVPLDTKWRHPWPEYLWLTVGSWLLAIAISWLRPDSWKLTPIRPKTSQDYLSQVLGCSVTDLMRLGDPLLLWALLLVILACGRLVLIRFVPEQYSSAWTAPLDRLFGRVVALSCAWSTGLLVLNLALFLNHPIWTTASGAGSGGLAAYLLNRFASQAPTRSRDGGAGDVLRLLSPQILSYLAIVLIVAGVTTGLLELLDAYPQSWLSIAIVCCVTIGAAMWALDPNRTGLHSFYRDRLTRAYLGASNFLAPNNRQVVTHPDDDFPLSDLDAAPPLHLWCLTANDLSGDTLATLNRGGRSAVLSRYGFSVGDRAWNWDETPKVSAGTAMAAAAAAFNPNMGSYSSQLGKGVTFLLGMLNLRLGYWLQLRTTNVDRMLPGLTYFREMFGGTSAGSDSTSFHLSDGGHFENLALYELLRRHCRFILVSDCGADPDCAFDDVGNALRRARTDFGVEVELDLSPLKPGADGRSIQHAAVGDILYNNGDRGIIVLFKPVITGKEPDDVLQYCTRNKAFPHESTGDQFYDEAQWESYYRLGIHSALTTFRFAQAFLCQGGCSLPVAFGRARLDWYAAPTSLQECARSSNTNVLDIERQLAEPKAQGILRALYPELDLPAPTDEDPTADSAALLPILNQLLHLLEDVFVSCELERHWNHPLSAPWMNYFGRWFTTPIVRQWWPVLSPMFNRKAMSFAARHFALTGAATLAPAICELPPADRRRLATSIWLEMNGKLPGGKRAFSYLATLASNQQIELAVVFVETQQTPTGKCAAWDASEFFVPPSFWASGIGGSFLKDLVSYLRDQGFAQATVTIKEAAIRDEAARKQFSDLVQMYRELHFRQTDQTTVLVNDPKAGRVVVLQRKLAD